jgi:hypothetical protein
LPLLGTNAARGTERLRHVQFCVTPVALYCAVLLSTLTVLPRAFGAETALATVVVNVRDLGAIGDGTVHFVSDWVKAGRFSNLRAIQKLYPFVDNTSWTIDEVAFERAKLALPPAGGTIHFPSGHYLAGRHGWRVWRDNVRLLGDGPEQTILATAPNGDEGLVLSPYRHIGWLEGAGREYLYTSESGGRGDDGIQLTKAEWAREFKPGERVFIRNGANRFDQDYGEFNEIAAIRADGRLQFKFPFARDYRLARFNWATEVARDFKLPREGGAVSVEIKTGEGYFLPAVGEAVTVDQAILRVEKTGRDTLRLSNPGRGNPPRGTLVHAGTKIGKSRALIKVTRTSQNFRCEHLQIVGHRKTLNLSNSYDSAFVDCTFRRDSRAGNSNGGLTIDGDGGRFARFEHCTVIAQPAAGMQFARSFGGVVFSECHFVDANVAFTEFSFDCAVTGCTFEVKGSPGLPNVIVAGVSCGDLRFIDNQIRAQGVKTIFDTYSDIHSQKHGSEGGVIVRRNTIATQKGVRVFTFPEAGSVTLENNQVTEQ